MNPDKIKEMLVSFKDGAISIDDAMEKLKGLPFEDLGFARIDHHRELRVGFPEVIYCSGKTKDQIFKIISRMKEMGSNILSTRIPDGTAIELMKIYPEARHYPEARLLFIESCPVKMTLKTVTVVTGGTSDIPVAEEAAITAEVFGSPVKRIYDAGVAGLHRLLYNLDEIRQANVVIAVAGMEGALASIVGGLVDKPVIAVPTSVGYGANFGGLSALLSMLNSCASGVSVVNIDNGFGAGYLAALINRL